MGVVFAVLTALAFALYVAPRKLSRVSASTSNLLMSVGFLVASVGLYLIQRLFNSNEGLFVEGIHYAVLFGLLFTIAMGALVKSIDLIGLARSNQWKNLQGPIGAICSLVLLNESAAVNPWLVIGSGLLISSAATAFNIRPDQETTSVNNSGILFALLSGLAFGLASTLGKWLTDNVGVYNQQVYISATMVVLFAGSVAKNEKNRAFVKKIPRREIGLGLVSGMLLCTGITLMFESFQRLEASIAFTIIQLNFLGVLVLGIVIFKEITVKGNYRRLLTGLVLAFAGVLILTAAK